MGIFGEGSIKTAGVETISKSIQQHSGLSQWWGKHIVVEDFDVALYTVAAKAI